VTVSSETQDKLFDNLTGFSFFNPSMVGEELFLISLYSALKRGPKELRDLLLATLRQRKVELLIIDGVRAMRDLWKEEATLREFFHELSAMVATLGCGCVLSSEYPLNQLMGLPEATATDGIVS
jgi:circadian clock protein KaiC